MKLTLLGVTGSTGEALLEQALVHGHDITAVARTPAKVTASAPNLKVVAGDVMAAETLVAPFAGGEAIVCCVGVASPMQARKGTTVYSAGTRNIVDAMHKAGARRLITVSSAGVAPRKGAPIVYKLIVKPYFLEPSYRDMRLMEAFLRSSNVDWTIVRPPYLTDGGLRTDYRLQADQNFDDDKALPRSSLAHFLLAEAEAPQFVRHVVAISG
jgi:putative NADH-flavin reductase